MAESVAEMTVDASYEGPVMEDYPTKEFVIEMMAWFKEQKTIHRK